MTGRARAFGAAGVELLASTERTNAKCRAQAISRSSDAASRLRGDWDSLRYLRYAISCVRELAYTEPILEVC